METWQSSNLSLLVHLITQCATYPVRQQSQKNPETFQNWLGVIDGFNPSQKYACHFNQSSHAWLKKQHRFETTRYQPEKYERRISYGSLLLSLFSLISLLLVHIITMLCVITMIFIATWKIRLLTSEDENSSAARNSSRKITWSSQGAFVRRTRFFVSPGLPHAMDFMYSYMVVS